MLIPEEWGGAGLDTISYVLMLEEVARVDAAMAVALSVTNSVVAWPLWRHGNDEQRRKYLPQLARGEMLGAFCLTEPQAGSDAAAIQTRAVREREDVPAQRDEKLGHQRRRKRRLSGFCEDASPPAGAARCDNGFSRGTGLLAAFASADTKIKWACALRARRKLFLPIARCPPRIAWARKGRG